MNNQEKLQQLIANEMATKKVNYDTAWANVKSTAEGQELMGNTGTSEGAEKGWQSRKESPVYFASRMKAESASEHADKVSDVAEGYKTKGWHEQAAQAHGDAFAAHLKARDLAFDEKSKNYHNSQISRHIDTGAAHRGKAKWGESK